MINICMTDHKANKPQKYLQSLIDGETYCWINGKFISHLKKHGLTYQEYYETYVTGHKEFCEFCSKPRALLQGKHVYQDTCGDKQCQAKLLSRMKKAWSPEKNAEVNAKRAKTTMELYGVDMISKNPDTIRKAREANSKILPNGKTVKQDQQDKARATKLARYGNAFYNNPVALKAGKAAMTPEAKQRVQVNRKATCMAKYGVDNCLLLPDVISKANRGNAQLKDYVLPSGETIKVQGFEPRALDLLFETYTQDQIKVSDPCNRANCEVPSIKYKNLNGNICTYYPDIFIPDENRIVEVKSRWWFDGYGRDGYQSRLENNMRKLRAANLSGYKFEFWVWELDGTMRVIDERFCG